VSPDRVIDGLRLAVVHDHVEKRHADGRRVRNSLGAATPVQVPA
jgi:hypothetical protein